MTSSSEGEILQNSQVIRERWKIKQKIGGGGFGEIYEAIDTQNHNERVAVKVESSKATKQVLKMEVAVLRRLQGKKHACRFFGCGRNEKFNYLVMGLQGKNLADLRRESPKQCFSLSTSLRLAVQILQGIKEIHTIGFLHRDIKPSNFAMGRTPVTSHTVYMLDFGLARLFLNAKGEIRSPRSAAGFRGTVRYAAVSAHKNKEMGRHDDLWSLFYMLAEMMQGALPWRRIKDKDEVGRMKEECNLEQLLDGCPPEIMDIPTHLKSLAYSDEPDYDRLERSLRGTMQRLGIAWEEPFDWELAPTSQTANENSATQAGGQRGGTKGVAGQPGGGGNASTRMRSHTTALRDKGPDGTTDRNRALETQAPVTIGDEDMDDNTGNYYRVHGLAASPMAGTGALSPMSAPKWPAQPANVGDGWEAAQDGQLFGSNQRPKYKQREFMRPKYGAVSYDVIDAVNARLAAASSQSNQDLNKENGNDADLKCGVGDGRAPGIGSAVVKCASVTAISPRKSSAAAPTVAAGPKKAPTTTTSAASAERKAFLDARQELLKVARASAPPEEPSRTTAKSGETKKPPLEQQKTPLTGERSMTLSIGNKRYHNGSKLRDVAPSGGHSTGSALTPSGSGDKLLENANKPKSLPASQPSNNNGRGREDSLPRIVPHRLYYPAAPYQQLNLVPLTPLRYRKVPMSQEEPSGLYPTTATSTLPRQSSTASGGYLTPMGEVRARRLPGSVSAAPLTPLVQMRRVDTTMPELAMEAGGTGQPREEQRRGRDAEPRAHSQSHGGGGRIMSHFKSLVHSFNSISVNSPLAHVRRRSLSRGAMTHSLEMADHSRERQSQQSKASPRLVNSPPSAGAGGHTSASSATTPTSGLGTNTNTTGGGAGMGTGTTANQRRYLQQQTPPTQQLHSSGGGVDEEGVEEEREREFRRLRRHQRRKSTSDQQNTAGTATVLSNQSAQLFSPSTSPYDNDQPSYRGDGGNESALDISPQQYFLQSRFRSNGRTTTLQASVHDDDAGDYGGDGQHGYQVVPRGLESAGGGGERKESLAACRRKRYQFLTFAPRALSKS